MNRECDRYGLDHERAASTMQGHDPLAESSPPRRWWEAVVILAAMGVFVRLAGAAERPPLTLDVAWTAALMAASLAILIVCGVLLWKRTRFS